MSSVDKQVADILQNYGEPLAGNVWRVQGTLVIYHKTLERIAAQAKVIYDPPQIIRSEREEAVILVTGRMGDRVEWSIGEALIGVNYRISGRQAAYVYAMAEKRAKDRVILKLVGLHGLLYSEEEADEFRNGRPGAGDDEDRPAPREDRAPAKADQRRAPTKDKAREEPAQGEPSLKTKIDQATTINAVTDLMLDPETQKRLAAMPDAERDDVRDHAKARLVSLGWPAKKKARPAGEPDDEERDPSSLVKQAGMHAKNPEFWAFLRGRHGLRIDDEEGARIAIHDLCDVESRSEFVAGSDAAARWVKLARAFRAWEQETAPA